MNPYQSQSQAQSINPALLASFQGGSNAHNKYSSPGINPAQLMNGMGMGGMNMNQMGNPGGGMGAINPAQLLQHQQSQQQQQHLAQQRGIMNGMMAAGGMNPMMSNMGMGGGINPAALTSPTSPPASANPMLSSPNPISMGMGNMHNMMSSGNSPSSFNDPRPPSVTATSLSSMGHHSNPNPMGMSSMNPMLGASGNMMGGASNMTMNMPNMGAPMPNMNPGQSNMNIANALGYTREQFNNMTPQERHIVNAKLMLATQQQQQQQQLHQQQPPQHHTQQMAQHHLQQQYDRPSSSASMHSMSNTSQMMPPPPPRPPTAQSNRSAISASGISRPGTAMGMRTRAAATTSDGSPPSYPPAQQQQQHRPPSRTGENGMMGSGMQNGYPPSTPQMQHHPHMNPGPSSPPPQTPGSPSPYRSGLKRKMPDSSPIGAGNMGGMNVGGGGNMMGPPHMPGHSQMQPGLNGFPPSAQAQTAQAQRTSPRPMSASGIGMPNMGMSGMGNMSNMSMNMSGPSISGGGGGIGGIAGIGNLNLGMGGAGGMNSGMGGGMPGSSSGMGHSASQQQHLQRQHSGFPPPNVPPQSIVQPPTPSQTMQSHQHQAMLMAQASSQGIEMQTHQQQMRQGSLPPPPPINAGALPTQLGMVPTKPPPSAPSSRMPSVAPPLPIPIVPGPGTASAIAASGISGVPSIGPSTSTASSSSATQPILPPLPAGTNLNANVTRVTVVPLMNSDKTIPPLNEKEKSDIQEWMKIDNEYETRFKQMKERMNNEMRTDVFGPLSVNWWEKGAPSVNPGIVGQRRRTRELFDVRYAKKNRDVGRGRKPGRREGFKL